MALPRSGKTLLIISKGQSPSPYQLYADGQEGRKNKSGTNKVRLKTPVPAMKDKERLPAAARLVTAEWLSWF